MKFELPTLATEENLCRTLAILSSQTWNDLKDAYRSAHELGEESITDFLILALKRRHPYEVWINKFTKRQEGRTSGADWEWWFGRESKWFGIRVQAKKIDTTSLEYPSLFYTVRRGKRKQINLLINDARRRNLYPLYCFYNYWDKLGTALPWNCGTYKQMDELHGCTIADARAVRRLMKRRRVGVSDLAVEWFPWICLACCRGFAKETDPSLPERARGLALAMSASSRGVPELRHAPSYVSRLMEHRPDQQTSIGMERLDYRADVDGLLVIKERTDHYQ